MFGGIASKVLSYVGDVVQEFQGRIVGPKITKPISRTALFSIVFAGYVAVLFWFTAQDPETFAIVKALCNRSGEKACSNLEMDTWNVRTPVLFAVVLSWCWLLRLKDWVFDFGLPGLKLRSVGTGAIYVAFWLDVDVEKIPLLTYVSLQALLLAFVYETYSRPLLPEYVFSNEELRQLHLNNWKKVASITLAVLALFATAIVQFYPENGGVGDAIPMATLTVIPLSSVLLYVHWKVTAPFRTGRLLN